VQWPPLVLTSGGAFCLCQGAFVASARFHQTRMSYAPCIQLFRHSPPAHSSAELGTKYNTYERRQAQQNLVGTQLCGLSTSYPRVKHTTSNPITLLLFISRSQAKPARRGNDVPVSLQKSLGKSNPSAGMAEGASPINALLQLLDTHCGLTLRQG